LEKSAVYANFLAEKLERQQKQAKEAAERKEQAIANKSANSSVVDILPPATPLRRSDRSAQAANATVNSAPEPVKPRRGRPPKQTATTTTTGRKRAGDKQADYNLADYVNAEVIK
jgi:ATP-dependent DNA helicase